MTEITKFDKEDNVEIMHRKSLKLGMEYRILCRGLS